MPLFSNNFEAFGLDIGDRSLKIAHIKTIGSTPSLSSYGTLALADDIFDKGEIKKPEALADSLRQAVAGARGKKITTAYVHACLPETHTFIKLLTLTCPVAGELPAKIREELPNHFPVSADELYLDWQIVDPPAGGLPNDVYKIVVGAAPRLIADSFTACLLAAGLTPVTLQIEAEAILRSLLPQADLPATPIAVIDIGATRSSFICFDQGSIQFSTSLSFAGDTLTALIAQALKLPTLEAEKAKIICGLDPTCAEGIVSSLMGQAVDELTLETKKNIAYYNEHFAHASPITSVILCGGGSHTKKLKETLEQGLGNIRVYLGNPLINLVKNLKSVVAKKGNNQALNFLSPDVTFEKIPAKGWSAFGGKTKQSLPADVAVTYTTAIGLGLTNVL